MATAPKSNLTVTPQLAIFLDNRPGTLARTCEALAAAKINILGLAIVDAMDHAIVRMVVDKPKDAEQVLAKLHAVVQRRDVIMMDVPNQVGALARVAEQLAEAGINLEYAYCTASAAHSGGAIVLRTNDLEATINALS